MKHTIAALSCTAALIASLTACGSGDDKSTLPMSTSGSNPSTTSTTRPTTTPPTSTPTDLIALAPSSTYNFDGLKFVVNLPPDIPKASRLNMRILVLFLRGVGQTMAKNRLDPSVKELASASITKYIGTFANSESVQGIGAVTFTISTVKTVAGSPTRVTGCFDQSGLRQVGKNGHQFVEALVRKKPTFKMSARITGGMTGPKITYLTMTATPC